MSNASPSTSSSQNLSTNSLTTSTLQLASQFSNELKSLLAAFSESRVTAFDNDGTIDLSATGRVAPVGSANRFHKESKESTPRSDRPVLDRHKQFLQTSARLQAALTRLKLQATGYSGSSETAAGVEESISDLTRRSNSLNVLLSATLKDLRELDTSVLAPTEEKKMKLLGRAVLDEGAIENATARGTASLALAQGHGVVAPKIDEDPIAMTSSPDPGSSDVANDSSGNDQGVLSGVSSTSDDESFTEYAVEGMDWTVGDSSV
ncbi:hypothetical protein M427DRAFT_53826 [Gonapodya prolifera JEL478]|uniref:Uncharacterized protein n=1 Tax=Gonapodya prolifera (strain JEL478) TaxID=1344416 RepID=A0A139ANX7_GONPJ|nr:hypothetical protein M427DRAFT_53826 [Gonapodya prolifera JEL478]|eukprot:KXS18442.1 hypothetical protein M427DRAFT_53826 [Gonapodya prolifera JEL478]